MFRLIFSESLKKRRDFKLVYSCGNSYSNKFLVVYTKKNSKNKNFIGISVSKKIGNSVVRHRITRLIKENYRLSEKKILCGYDMIFLARKEILKANFLDIKKSIFYILKKQSILNVVKKY